MASLKYPIIYPHRNQPKDARDMGITLVNPGILRVRFRNPFRIVSTDRYRARRQVRHIQEGYTEELETNQRILNDIKDKHLALVKQHRDVEAICKIRDGLDKVLDSLERIHAPTKLYARDKLEDAVTRLDEVEQGINGFEREQRVGPACNELCDFIARYGEWRGKEVERINKFMQERELVLLPLRDEFLRENLRCWANTLSNGNGFRIRNVWQRDEGIHKEILEIVEKGNGVASRIEPIQKRISGKYDVSYLDDGCRLINDGRDKKGRRLIREFALALGTRNPLVAVPEVSGDVPEEVDRQLDGVIDLIGKGQFHRVVACCEKALRLWQKPQQI